jgi:phosphatidylglycerol:prolipoprotein diacylglycerol transferase
MFPIILKIEPYSIYIYGIIVTAIAVIGMAILLTLSRKDGFKRERVALVLFWVLALSIMAMVPMFIPVTIYAYGLLLAMAVLIGTFMLVNDARASNIKPGVIYDLVFWAVVGGIIGARAFYVFLNLQFFASNPHEILMIQKGGLAWQGGLILGVLVTTLFIKRRKLFLPAVFDLLAPYLALGQSIGRIGCFLNGCCYGKAVAWGIYFPVHDARLHPTQLYLAAGYFVIFIILKRYQSSSQIPGLVFSTYLILASTLRFFIEFFRADHEILFLGLSVYQFVCLGILIFAFSFAYVMLIKYSQPEDE